MPGSIHTLSVYLMKTRIHIVMSDTEKAHLERAARRAGKSLSAWMREAALSKAESAAARALGTADELRAFFAESDEREEGREPDWAAHREVIEASRRSGAP